MCGVVHSRDDGTELADPMCLKSHYSFELVCMYIILSKTTDPITDAYILITDACISIADDRMLQHVDTYMYPN